VLLLRSSLGFHCNGATYNDQQLGRRTGGGKQTDRAPDTKSLSVQAWKVINGSVWYASGSSGCTRASLTLQASSCAVPRTRASCIVYVWPSQLDPFDQAVTSKSSVVVKTDDATFTSQNSSSITCVLRGLISSKLQSP
jgi:hypothetical protein